MKGRTTLLCINPRSRGGRCASQPFVERLRRLGPVVYRRLGESELDVEISALNGRLARVVIGGGDGTLHRALPAVVAARVPPSRAPRKRDRVDTCRDVSALM